MGRKRLIALLAGVVLVVPLPVAALEPVTTEPVEAVTSELTDAASSDSETAEGDEVSVPLPGLGEATVAAGVEPEDQSAEVSVSADLEQSDLDVSTQPELTVTVSTSDVPQVDLEAPTSAGPVEADPTDALDPVLDLLDDVAGALPGDGSQPAPSLPGPGGDDVERAGVSSGGPRAADLPAATVPVMRRLGAPAARVAAEPVTSVFDEPPVAAPGPAAPDVAPVAAPVAPEPVSLPALLKLLTALLVVAAGVTNRVVARELG